MTEVESASKPDWRERTRNSRLGTFLVLLITAGLVLGLAYYVDRPATAKSGITAVTLTGAKSAGPKIGKPAPDFTATTTDGRQVSLSSFRGHPVWLTFGASWCAACEAESPDIEAAYEKAAPQGAVVLAIFISEDSATVRDYAQRIGLTYSQVADPNTTIASAYRVFGIPAHFFIDSSGILRNIVTGSLTPSRMDSQLAAIGG